MNDPRNDGTQTRKSEKKTKENEIGEKTRGPSEHGEGRGMDGWMDSELTLEKDMNQFFRFASEFARECGCRDVEKRCSTFLQRAKMGMFEQKKEK